MFTSVFVPSMRRACLTPTFGVTASALRSSVSPNSLIGVPCRSMAIVSSHLEPGEIRSIPAMRRVGAGSSHCYKLRGDRWIPGIIYGVDEEGKEDRILVQVKRNVIENEFHAFGRSIESIIYDIEIDGVTTRVLPRCLTKHPLTEAPTSLNFLRYWSGCPKRKVKIPVEYFNEEKSPGVRRGGSLMRKMRDLVVYISGPWVPPRVEVNLDGMKLGHKIHARDIDLPEGVCAVRENDLLAMVSGKKSLMREQAKENAKELENTV